MASELEGNYLRVRDKAKTQLIKYVRVGRAQTTNVPTLSQWDLQEFALVRASSLNEDARQIGDVSIQ